MFAVAEWLHQVSSGRLAATIAIALIWADAQTPENWENVIPDSRHWISIPLPATMTKALRFLAVHRLSKAPYSASRTLS
jgi:hypothetical protein